MPKIVGFNFICHLVGAFFNWSEVDIVCTLIVQAVMIGGPRGRPAAKGQVWLALALATVVKVTIIRNLIMHSIRYVLLWHSLLRELLVMWRLVSCPCELYTCKHCPSAM